MNTWKQWLMIVCLSAGCGTAADDGDKSNAPNNGDESSNTSANSGASTVTCNAACQQTSDVCPIALGGATVEMCAQRCEASSSTAARSCLAAAQSCDDVAACDSGGSPSGSDDGDGNDQTPPDSAANNADDANNDSGSECVPYVDTDGTGCSAACGADEQIYIDGDQLCTERCGSDADCDGGAKCNTAYNGGVCLFECVGSGLACPEGYLENSTGFCGNSGWCGI